MSFTAILGLLISSILINNYIFSRFLGICPFLGLSNKTSTAVGMGLAVTFVMTVSTAVTWCVYHFVLVPAELEYLKTIAFILIIASLVQLLEMFLRKAVPSLYAALGIYLPLITTNCAILGSAVLCIQNDYSFIPAVVFSFGSALGITRLCVLCEKEPYLVIDEVNESLQEIFRQAKESDNYQFISSEKAVSLADEESLLIVTDTHRPSLVQCPELLKICERIVVVDHHRKMEECIENPVLAYMESYASSASELVAEMLQYMISKKSLNKLEAEALLAGMTIDTNGFSVKTGVRTFEAAAWLRRQGADPTEVKRFFQEEISNIKLRAEAVLSAQVYENGVAISACRKERSDAQILCAQVADQLLTVKGVKASFVAGRNDAGKTVISARSLGEVNVQVIMEKFGGGGHLTTAAAQVDSGIGETIKKIMDMMEVEQDDSNLK